MDTTWLLNSHEISESLFSSSTWDKYSSKYIMLLGRSQEERPESVWKYSLGVYVFLFSGIQSTQSYWWVVNTAEKS